jgi:uncharacterized protein YwlG (UPF0340 family)
VLALYLFGGEVLHGFSFALVIGILIGTYSSIAIAAPILVAYQDWRSNQGKPVALIAGKSMAGMMLTQTRECNRLHAAEAAAGGQWWRPRPKRLVTTRSAATRQSR